MAIGPPDSTMMPATVNGATYLISSVSPAARMPFGVPASSSATASESCDARTERSLRSNPAASNAATALRKCSRSGNEPTASRTIGKDFAASVMPILAFVLGPGACYRQTPACVSPPLPDPSADDRTPRLAGHGSVPRDQAGEPGLPVVLPDGRFLRAVLRGCGRRGTGARYSADQTRPAQRRRHPDVRGAGAHRGSLSRPPDPRRLQGRDVRPDRGPC